ncbi:MULTISPECIES: porin [unclassified Variovorax]|jgi:predicted porin|uniref:porin n=1 Tax=unclassified Variovorax TaxID=663243 RepID=UPI0008987ABA|nr:MULTISPECIES: porin [unclassified Variovorax]SDY23441.1 Outer membrane protein (porin) [Variovorax sp. YR634]SET88829.1 Outer membrane protein (porin) [Variovorax sp. OV084]
MKKSLLVLAALAACGAASAQSTVTLFGVVDAAYRNVSNKSESTNPFGPFYSVKASRTELANSGLSSSRLGFRGVEDLGGGLSASFWLESPITNDDGATGLSNFSRRSTVSLAGSFGEIRLGRDKTATVLNEEQFDPFADTGIGGSLIIDANETSVSGTGYGSNSTYKRAGNMVQYFLPRNLGGFYGNVGYSLHELTRTSPDSVAGADKTNTGRHIGGRVGYAAGPLDVAASYAQNDTSFTTGSGAAAVARPGKIKTFNLGATYDFGVAKLFGEYSRSKDQRDPLNVFTRVPDVDLTGYLIGVTVPIGPGQIRASYSQVKYDFNRVPVLGVVNAPDPKSNKLALGYVHNLSKRTALYGTIARVSNKNGAGNTVGAGPSYVVAFNRAALQPKSSMGYEFGIRHAF